MAARGVTATYNFAHQAGKPDPVVSISLISSGDTDVDVRWYDKPLIGFGFFSADRFADRFKFPHNWRPQGSDSIRHLHARTSDVSNR
jgi:hypothetical protein